MSQFPIEDALKPECDSIRADLLAIEIRIRKLDLFQPGVSQPRDGLQGFEREAQATLALRHVEDARMRIGKVLQHARDGVSCFDHTKETP